VREYPTKSGFDEPFDRSKCKGRPLFPLVCAVIPSASRRTSSGRPGTARVPGSQERTGHPQRCEPPDDRPCGGDNAGGADASPEKSVLDVRSGAHGREHRYLVGRGVCERNGTVRFGCSRDRRPDLRQVNFGAVELRGSINIPIDLFVDRGNASDSVQSVKIVDEVGDLREIRCSCSMPRVMRNGCSTASPNAI